ncbi:MAG: bifunctional hydroxymethylpyrimidine kinase/phosphomethylpyrimidine kinase [Deltaproteobacteria bacterium]|nr:MAG: bifunctional hydroxymethylpyrimidine kinase/phosphomethylpyrimidine kinase [Deltaproteobacteria bacterium]
MKIVLSIAGSDPSGGAGIQADLKTFSSFGVYGLSVITSLTAQNTRGIREAFDLPPAFIRKQLNTINRDFTIDAVKIGMLRTKACVELVSRWLAANHQKNIVLDPVLKSSTGKELLKEEGIEMLKRKLLPLARIVTPNLNEASTISGIEVRDLPSMKEAARRIKSLGARSVLIKGGHLQKSAIDLFYDGRTFIQLQAKKIKGEFHGTGCTLSSATAAGLAKGWSTKKAVGEAKQYLTRTMESGFGFGKGQRLLNHNIFYLISDYFE